MAKKSIKFITGGLLDQRNDTEKSKDYKHSEVVASSVPVIWEEKSFEQLRKFPDRFQFTSSSCMAQSGNKNLGIANWFLTKVFPILSCLSTYRKRENYPKEGMSLPNLFELLTTELSCLEKDIPSQNLTEDEMNNANISLSTKELSDAVKYKADGYFYFEEPYNIDDIALSISQGKPVEAMIFFDHDEYWQPIPKMLRKVDIYAKKTARHGIAIVDFLLIGGIKYLYIEDSAGNTTGINKQGRRYLSEEFFTKRCFGAGYLVKKSYVPIVKPEYTFKKVLVYNMRNNKDVIALQNILQYEGFMPTQLNKIPFTPTGNFLGMTAQALIKWQISHGILDFQDEIDMTKVRFGNKSMVLANKLYNIKK